MNYIESDKRICIGGIEAGASDLRRSIESLGEEVDNLTPLMNECKQKGIYVQKEFPEVYQEWNELHEAINEGEKRLLNMGVNQIKLL